MGNELILLGKKISELRNKKGLTQEKLAEITNYSTNHIAKLEAARTNPSFELIVAIAKALNVDIKDLFLFGELNSHKYIRNELKKIVNNADNDTIKILYKFYCTLFN